MSSLSSSFQEIGPVPWSKTAGVGPSSSFAPGPPSRNLFNKKSSPLQKSKMSANTTSPLPKMYKLATPLPEKKTTHAECRQNGKDPDGSCPNSPSDSVEAIKEAAERNDIEGWDPRKLDYCSSKFNSYTGGPGQMVQTREQKDVITLYVQRIPKAITKEGLRNLFTEAGTVKRVAIPPVQLGWDTAYGFVEFGTVREAETAIQLLHNKDMGRGVRLAVKITESKKNRDERLQIKKEDEEFIKTLHCGKNDEDYDEQHDSEAENENSLSNPLQPRYISNNTEMTAEGVAIDQNSLNSSGDASSYNALSDKAGSEKHSLDSGGGMHSPCKKKSYASSISSDADTVALLPCTVCQKPTSSRCPLCKTYYCTTKCQRQDWPKHRQECGHKVRSSETANLPTNRTINASLCIADCSDDDGFVLDCPSSDDLVPVKELLHQTKDKGDLASSVSEEASSSRFFSLPLPSDQSAQMNGKKPEQPTSEVKSFVGGMLSKSMPSVKTSFRKTPPFSPPRSEAIQPRTLDPFKGAPCSSAILTSPKPSAICSSLSIANDALHVRKRNTPANLELGLASLRLTCNGMDAPTEERFVPINLIYSQFDLIKQPLLSVPLNSFPPPEFQAIVTFYFSPTQFNVIIPSVEVKQALQLIQLIGTTLQPGSLLSSQLSQDSKCGYKDKRGDFLRVTVNEVCSPETIMVHRFDFGGDLSVPVWELYHLPEELVLIPCLGHRCCLQDIFISDHGKATFQVLKELVNGEPIMIQNLSPSHNPNINCLICLLKNKGGSVNKVLLSSPYVIGVDVQAKERGNLTSPSLKLSCAASKVPYHNVHPGTKVVILPTVVINPCIIWAQVVHPHLSMMEKMHKDLNTFYPPRDVSSALYVPVVGEICVAKYCQDQQYYRAEVLCVNHSGTVDIRFTETGRTEIVTTTQLHHIQPKFLTMPRQARKFSMCGVAPIQSSWTNNAIAFLKDKILNRRVTVRVVTTTSNELASEIFDPDLDSQILNNSLILLGHAQVCHNDLALKCSSKTNWRGVSVLTTPPGSPLTSKSPLARKLSNETLVLDGTVKCRQHSGGFQGSPKSGFLALKESTNSRLHNPSERVKLSVGDCVNVNVSHVIGLERFCVQLVAHDNLAKVKVMLEKIENAALIPLPVEQYKIGKHCLCFYPEDNHVHRAVIKSYTKNRVVVHFVDYGNTFSTSDHIYGVKEDLFDFPFQAIVCSLNMVRNPAGSKKEWDPVALKFFRDILETGQPKIKVVDVVGALHVVDVNVSRSDGVVDVLKALCEAGYVMDSKQCRERHNSTRKISTTAQQQDGRNDEASHPTANKYESNTSRTLGAGKVVSLNKNKSASVLASCSQMSYPSLSTMKKLSFPQTNEPFSVVVCEVVTIQEIYVQVVTEDSATAISQVSEALGSCPSNTIVSLSSFPPVGSLCCAKFSQDQMWYRCLVESVCGDRLSVFFVDYGNRDSVVLSDLALCPALCTSVPIVAIRCGLGGLSSMVVQEDKAAQFLRDHTADCMVSVKVVSEAESIPQVLMRANDLDFVEEMTKQGIIVSSKTGVYPFISTPDPVQLPTGGGEVKILMTEVTSPSEMYLQIVTAEVGKQFIKIKEGINAYFKSRLPQYLSSFPKVGSLCCAKFYVDQLWYRVEVLQIVENGCIVFFVDYGNKETVSLSDIALCPSEFCSQPLLAVKCALGGLPSNHKADKVTQYLRQHSVDTIMLVKVVGEDNGTPLLELHNNKGINLLEEMYKLGLISDVVSKPSFPFVQGMVCCTLPNSGPFQVVVAEIVNSMEFYIQMATTEVAAMLSKIAEGINSESRPMQLLSSFPKVGSLCCAKFSMDMRWYRVEVLQVNEKSSRVFFVDFGNKDEVPLSSMAACPSEFSSLPLVAVKCSLNGLPPKLALSDKITVHLQQCLSNSLVSASVVGVTEDNTPRLEIQRDGKNLLDQMSELGLLKLPEPEPKISRLLVKDMSCIPLPVSGTFPIMVTEVVNSMEFYIQVATTEIGAMLNMITEGINSSKTLPLQLLSSPPEIGSLCRAKFSMDEQWYRAEVLQMMENSCHVFFVDFGNKDKVPFSDIATCPTELSSLPLVAVKCGLNGLPPKLALSDKITVHLQQCLSNSLVSASVVGVTDDNTTQLEIKRDGKNLLEEMSELGLLELPEPKVSLLLVKDMSCIPLPNSGTFQVMVTEVISPMKFYIQVATSEVGAMLSKITEGINSETQPLPCPPEVGSLCCAKFSIDEQWYRTEVLQVNEKSCHVFFVDFGNKDEVPLSNMAACPPELSSLPLVAVKCGLNGLPPKLALSDKITVHLQQCLSNSLVSASVVGVTDDNTTQLEIQRDGKNLLEEMSELGLLKLPEPKISRLLVKDMSCIPLPVSGTFQIMVTEVVNSMEFYIQVATTEIGAMLNMITEGINSSKTLPLQLLSSPPEVGSLCRAKFSMDEQWYRTEVLQVNEKSCHVFFVDFGNKDEVPLSSMAACPSEFSSLPLVAVKCSLNGLPPKLALSDKITVHLQQCLSNSLVSASVVGVTEDNTPRLEIQRDGKNLLDQMSELGLLKLPEPKISHLLVKDMSCIPLPVSGTFPIMVTEVVNSMEFYIQVATTEIGAMLNMITEGINSSERLPLQLLSSPPEVGSLCRAKFSMDEQWYRAEVLQMMENSCRVFFVDFGNKDKVPFSDIATCPPELSSLPLVAVKCGLNGLPPKLALSDKITVHLQRCLSNSLVSASVVGVTDDNTTQLEIQRDGKNLLEEMSELGLLKLPEPKVSLLLVKDMSCIPLPNSGTFQVMVTEVISPMKFYIQVATSEVGAMLSKITEGINSETQPLPCPPEVGSLCCAKFSMDEQWYRTEVLQVNEKSCHVFFVDFGNKDEVPLSDMAACPSEFSSLPLVAVKCSLNGLPPKLALSDKITVHLQQCLSNSLVSASVVGVTEDNTTQLEVQRDGINLLDQMSELGLLKLPEPKISRLLVKDMSCIPLPVSGTFQIMVTEVVNSMEFYIQVATTEIEAMLNMITEGINSSETLPLQLLSSPLEVGSLCRAKFSMDEQWYRAEVLQMMENSCRVFFVDFGNKDKVPFSDIATCPTELSSLPLVAVKCGLNGLPPKLALSDKITVHLQRCLSNSLVSASVVGVTDGNTTQLEIQRDGKNLLEEMSELGLLKLPEPKVSLLLVKDMSCIPLPNSGTFQVMVTEVISPMKFYIQVATSEVGAMLSKITEGINSETQPLPCPPEVGSLCCAKFSMDEQWYRTEVLQVNEKSCHVFFVDFGNEDEVPLSDMATCPSEYSSLPRIAVNCSLSGLPPDINPIVEATNIFQQLTANSLVSAKMVGETNGIPQLELSNLEVSLLDEILKHGLVSKSSTSSLPPLIASMKKMVLPSSAMDAKVIEIVSLSEIYIQMLTQEVALLLTELLDSINEYFESNSSSFSSAPVGSLCCAKFSQDSLWYRAEVLAVEGGKYTVRFIDYGNMDTVSLSSLATCPSQFALLPVVAVRCCLGGISPSSVVSEDLAIQYLKQLPNDVASINVMSSINGIPQVKLSIRDKDVLSVMVEEGLISAPHPSADLKTLQFPPTSEHVQCVVYEVVSLSEFYIHVNNKEQINVLDKINETIESLFVSGPPKPLLIAPSIGDLCLAKFSGDNSWNRVRVKAVHGKACEVLYLDYRNAETIDLSNMVVCPAQIASLPQIAIKCSLGGLQSDYIATTEKISLFRKLTSNNCVLSATYLCDEEGGVPQIELFKDGKSILSLLGLSLSSFPLVANMKKLQFPSSSDPVQDPFQLLVCEINSPRDMYVQVNNESTVSTLKTITKRLEKFSTNTNPEPLLSNPPIGSLCCAKFALDDTWYRARIDGISGDCCKVFFIDYGNSEEVHLTHMAVCPPDILELPVVAIRCSLFGVCNLIPPPSACRSSALKILKNLMFGHLLNVSVVTDNLSECPVVQLADISDGTLISVRFQEMYRSSGSSLCKGQVTEVNDPGSLYFQYIHNDNASNLDLLNKLQDVYACPSAYKDFTPTLGSICCAQCPGDLCWYRCKVMSVTKDTIGLNYIDFGSVESLPTNGVYCLDKEFTAMPPLAVHCKINGIQPKHAEGWGGDVIDKLIDLCDKKFVFVSVIGSEGDLVTVDLFQDEDRQCSIGDSLVSAGHAVYT